MSVPPRCRGTTLSDLRGRRNGEAIRPTGDPCRIVTCSVRTSSDGSPIVRHDASPRRRPRGCHGRPASCCPGARSSTASATRASVPSVSVTPQSPPPGAGGAVDASTPSGSSGPTARAPSAPTLEVPVDYDKPQGDTIELAVVKVPAQAVVQADRVARRQPGRPGRVRCRLRAGRRLHRRQGRARRLRRRRLRPARRRALRHRSTASPTPSSTPSSALDPTPDDAGRGAGVRGDRHGASRSPAPRRPARCSATCRPSTPPATWTCCGPRSARRSSPTSASPTAPTSARSTPGLFPTERRAGWCSTASSPPTSPPRSSTSARPRASSSPPGSGPPTASSRATARWAGPSTR